MQNYNIGFRAHDFGSFSDAAALGRRVSEIQTPSSIQLALNKVIPTARKWKDWDDEYINTQREILASFGISTAVIGCYINPVHPDKDEREVHLKRFERSLELTKAFGCKVVGTETGSLTPDISYSLETQNDSVFETFLSSLDRMLNKAIKEDAICAIEPVAFRHTLSTARKTQKVLDTFKDEHLKIIFDPVNLIPQCGIPEADGSTKTIPTREAQAAFYNEALDIFEGRICIIHAKDFKLTDEGYKKGNLPILTGVFAWNDFFKELRKRNINVPILLENHNPETLKETLSALNKF